MFAGVKGTPWNTVPGASQDEIRSKVVFPTVYESITPDKPPETKEFLRGRIRITRDDVRDAGMTPGCEGCVAANRGITSRPHNEECRRRSEENMSKKQDRITEGNEKRLAEEVEIQVEVNKRNKTQDQHVEST